MLFLIVAAVVTAASPTPLAAAPSLEHRQEQLLDAARLGRTDLIGPLVASGANVNGRDERGFTPIILASYNGHLETTEALIAAKGDPCLPDLDQGNTAQMGVAFRGYDSIAAFLLKAGCPVNARNKAGQTSLMMAALFGRQAQIKMLVAAGGDPSILDAQGRSAASVAAGQGDDAVVKQLGAPPKR